MDLLYSGRFHVPVLIGSIEMEITKSIVTVTLNGDKLNITTEFFPVFDKDNPAHVAGALMALRYAKEQGARDEDFNVVPRERV
jgi:hypothetical protein